MTLEVRGCQGCEQGEGSLGQSLQRSPSEASGSGVPSTEVHGLVCSVLTPADRALFSSLFFLTFGSNFLSVSVESFISFEALGHLNLLLPMARMDTRGYDGGS